MSNKFQESAVKTIAPCIGLLADWCHSLNDKFRPATFRRALTLRLE